MTSSDDVTWLLSATLLSSYFEGKMLCLLQKLHDLMQAIMKTAVFFQHTPYSKMAANKLFFCFHVNEPSLPYFHFKIFFFYTC